MDLRRMEDWRN